MRPSRFFWLLPILLMALIALPACGDDDDDASADDDDASPVDDDDDNDDSVGDDDDDNDDNDDDDDDDDDDNDDNDNDDDDDDDDDDTYPPPTENLDAKADAFKLFYRERTERALLSLNRYGMAGDAVFANTFETVNYAQEGNDIEVVPGPDNNNPIGKTTYAAWKLYRSIGGRPLELALIRMFEGLAFNEAVSGHPGLTVREALPGWTLVMDGVGGSITRTREGAPFTPPVTYAPALEQEILDTFYDGVTITYREDPLEFYFNHKAINSYASFATIWVFNELPAYLRISDCCSSWKVTPDEHLWSGAYWGNHNSRDNLTDYAIGYLAAFDAESTPGLPADLAAAAARAAQAGRRTGDATVEAGMILMTVDEDSDYDTLTPAGHDRPDHHWEIEWQDLGSLGSCTMVYTAQAISSAGLSAPVPALPMPGDFVSQGIQHIFDLMGIPLQAPVPNCTSIDDAFIGMTWGGLLDLEIFGIPWYDLAVLLQEIYPGVWAELLGGTVDDFEEMILGAVVLCEYAQQTGDEQLFSETRDNMHNLIELTYIFIDLVYSLRDNPAVWAQTQVELGGERADAILSNVDKLRYQVALYGRMFDMDTPLEDFQGFESGNEHIAELEQHLTLGDTTPNALWTDQQLHDMILAPGSGFLWSRNVWIQERFTAAFGDTVPVRRAGDGYEAIGPDGQWQPTENSHHRPYEEVTLWHEAALCAQENLHTLDCSWARLGCAPADLNDSGAVDQADADLFQAAWDTFGEGAACDAGNGWCDGADLDQNGTLDADDQAFATAAQGCVR
jgi:hypothetical protein